MATTRGTKTSTNEDDTSEESDRKPSPTDSVHAPEREEDSGIDPTSDIMYTTQANASRSSDGSTNAVLQDPSRKRPPPTSSADDDDDDALTLAAAVGAANDSKLPAMKKRARSSSQSTATSATPAAAAAAAAAVEDRAALSSQQQQAAYKSRGKGRARLPDKLMEYLNAKVVPDVLWWLPGEEAFAIDASRIQKEVLDVYFRRTKLSSFIRSLNRWGFRRVFLHSLPKTAVCFHQRLFKKSAPHLVRQMELTSYTPQSAMAAAEQEAQDKAAAAVVAAASNNNNEAADSSGDAIMPQQEQKEHEEPPVEQQSEEKRQEKDVERERLPFPSGVAYQAERTTGSEELNRWPHNAVAMLGGGGAAAGPPPPADTSISSAGMSNSAIAASAFNISSLLNPHQQVHSAAALEQILSELLRAESADRQRRMAIQSILSNAPQLDLMQRGFLLPRQPQQQPQQLLPPPPPPQARLQQPATDLEASLLSSLLPNLLHQPQPTIPAAASAAAHLTAQQQSLLQSTAAAAAPQGDVSSQLLRLLMNQPQSQIPINNNQRPSLVLRDLLRAPPRGGGGGDYQQHRQPQQPPNPQGGGNPPAGQYPRGFLSPPDPPNRPNL